VWSRPALTPTLSRKREREVFRHGSRSIHRSGGQVQAGTEPRHYDEPIASYRFGREVVGLRQRAPTARLWVIVVEVIIGSWRAFGRGGQELGWGSLSQVRAVTSA